MRNKTLLNVKSILDLIYNNHFLTEFSSKNFEKITQKVVISRATELGLCKKIAKSRYVLNRKPNDNDAYAIYLRMKEASSIARQKGKNQESTLCIDFKHDVLLKNATIQQIAERIKELGFEGELTTTQISKIKI